MYHALVAWQIPLSAKSALQCPRANDDYRGVPEGLTTTNDNILSVPKGLTTLNDDLLSVPKGLMTTNDDPLFVRR